MPDRVKLTPSQSFEHIKETLVQYLEAQYRISDSTIVAERAMLLRSIDAVAKIPFVESTPAFVATNKLSDIVATRRDFLPQDLAELVRHGVPVDRFPLYDHQEEALLKAFSNKPNLLVATGTGSGKTETFLLPILADILNDATTWSAPLGRAQRGAYDSRSKTWVHSRSNETRPRAMQAIVLYPMNALVNDQLARLRRILARGTSPDWQRRNLNGNVIHFGMYTSLARPTGHWSDSAKRAKFDAYYADLTNDWSALRPELQESGSWARPDSPEMLCRWDMQAAPPDILVTNYSMLEYMLVRNIESDIFDQTRAWLEGDGRRLTLVLDEAHSYTGARGTEVAHLVRRLKERLGISDDSTKFRAIATSASLPNSAAADQDILRFASDLFGVADTSFSLVRLAPAPPLPPRNPSLQSLSAFANFQDTFVATDPWPSLDRLTSDLNLPPVDHTESPQVALYDALAAVPEVEWVRARAARNATRLDQLASECWLDVGTGDEQEAATAGVLAAGSFARPSDLPDTPPMLSMRLHAFFRGIAGVWACMNPTCTMVVGNLEPIFTPIQPRPVGRLYTDPRPWCKCGARVLELFSCRQCGLLFLGGIPDTVHGSLWPWSDDFTGLREDFGAFEVFGVEAPQPGLAPDFRSIQTTLAVSNVDPNGREVWPVSPTLDSQGQQISPYPAQCPRCGNFRMSGPFGPGVREVVEPLRTRGPRSFSVVVEDGFRVQPATQRDLTPNFGRKALLFSDSRLDAAQLAADVRRDHQYDAFRQLTYLALYACSDCDGEGSTTSTGTYVIGQSGVATTGPCATCGGTGVNAQPSPLSYSDLRARVLRLEEARGIDPTNGLFEEFFDELANGSASAVSQARDAFDVALRREVAEDDFSLEPLGLAAWRVRLPTKAAGSFANLSQDESLELVRSVARLLTLQGAIATPRPSNPWDWPSSVRDYERAQVVNADFAPTNWPGRTIPFSLTQTRKLGRYLNSVAERLAALGRITRGDVQPWLRALKGPLWQALYDWRILEPAGRRATLVPFAVRLDNFDLVPVGDVVFRCSACGYVMASALLDVCLRCGQQTAAIDPSRISNHFRRTTLHAAPSAGFDDPHPLRAIEHSAQIPGREARDLERWFQDFYRDDENPLDYRVDILSVTTTMEMGIDIGSLLSVCMRNVPPTVANYQQRAGRAGRRGSALATVLTYAQPRSHDQYYFDRPPEIISEPPRVPSLHLDNPIIARRHVNALVLQAFFRQFLQGATSSQLLEAWGLVGDFINRQGGALLRAHVTGGQASMLARSAAVVAPTLRNAVPGWLSQLPVDVDAALASSLGADKVLEVLLQSGLLPKYAFPIDVVSLHSPTFSPQGDSDMDDAMSRDLKIALSEYAPFAEVLRGEFPNTYLYRSAGLYDPFEDAPSYQPHGFLIECSRCQAIEVVPVGGVLPPQCSECQDLDLLLLPFVRPPGFTVDVRGPGGGRERYEGGGRDRSGSVGSARLVAGGSALTLGSQVPGVSALYSQVRIGQLFVANRGPDSQFPGFVVCEVCGRALDPLSPGPHRYPADIPPHFPRQGRPRGPRAGENCPNRGPVTNQVVLGHQFGSEIVLLAVDLPASLDGPFAEPSGRAVWYSFGTLVSQAASRVLQIDPDELKVGIRPMRRPDGRVHGEVYIYDDVPSGAGYARAIEPNLPAILQKALDLGRNCSNTTCPGACYQCLLEYSNQPLHPLLDRGLGVAVIEFLLFGTTPTVTTQEALAASEALAAFARGSWTVLAGRTSGGVNFPMVLSDTAGVEVGIWPIHPLSSKPSGPDRQSVQATSGVRPAAHYTFDLLRRPFWVLNNLV